MDETLVNDEVLVGNFSEDSELSDIDSLPSDEEELLSEITNEEKYKLKLQQDNDPQLKWQWQQLEYIKRSTLEQSYRNYQYRIQSAYDLCQYDCQQAILNYKQQCLLLKERMRMDIQKEIQRLQCSRDGVAVMDRRNRKRSAGTTLSSTTENSQSYFPLPTGSSVEKDGTNQNNLQQKYVDQSLNALQVLRLQTGAQTEKKWMEILHSEAKVFSTLNTQATDLQIENDIQTIESAANFSCIRKSIGINNLNYYNNKESNNTVASESKKSKVTVKQRLSYYQATKEMEGIEVFILSPTDKTAACEHAENDSSSLFHGILVTIASEFLQLLQENGTIVTIPMSKWKSDEIKVLELERNAELRI